MNVISWVVIKKQGHVWIPISNGGCLRVIPRLCYDMYQLVGIICWCLFIKWVWTELIFNTWNSGIFHLSLHSRWMVYPLHCKYSRLLIVRIYRFFLLIRWAIKALSCFWTYNIVVAGLLPPYWVVSLSSKGLKLMVVGI